MIELTAEDWHSIHCATKDVKDPFTTPEGISAIAEANYRAGLAAGIERAAKACEKVEVAGVKIIGKTEHYPGEYASECDIGYAYGCEDCAAAIRALNAPAAP